MGDVIDLELEIDELVVEGIPRSDRERFAGALRRELERLLRERVLPASLRQSREVKHLTPRTPSVPGDASANQLGAAVARTIYEALSR